MTTTTRTDDDATRTTDLLNATAGVSWEHRTIRHDGVTVVALDPLPGDWEYLEEAIGHEPTADEQRNFAADYREYILRLAEKAGETLAR